MKRRLPRVVAALLLFGLAARGLPPVFAVSQAEIDALEVRRGELQASQENMKEQMDSLQNDRESALARKAALDEQNELLRQDIVLLGEEIALYDEIVAEKWASAETARAEEVAQYDRYRRRVRFLEEHSRWSYLAFLFRAESLGDLLSRLNDIADIISHDRDLTAEYAAAREHAEAVAAEYETAQAARRDRQDELSAQETLLSEQIAAAGRLIAQLEDDIEFYEEFYASVEAEKAEVQALIDQKAAELRKRQEEEARRKNQALQAAGTASAGYYAWPSYTSYITSPFGPRIHPIYGEQKPHTGVDIGANHGTAITAAADGTVSAAVVNYGTTGYGTYAAIYHDNGTTTLYGHMSALAVSVGETVAQGQTIGYVGSTGAATGPHLHFEIRVNGSCVDPMQYFR